MRLISAIWHTYNTPSAIESEFSRRNYLTKVVITAVAVIHIPISILIIGGLIFGNWARESIYVVLLLLIGTASAGWFANHGYEQLGRLLVVSIYYLLGVFGTIKYGIASTLILFYVIVIFLSFMLMNRKTRNIALIISIVTPLLIEFFLWANGTIEFILEIITITCFFGGIGLMMGYFTNLLDSSIFTTSAYSKKLDEQMQDVHRRAEEAEILRKAGIYVTESLDFQETVNRILNELLQVVPHDSACVLLLREGGYLEIVGGQGWPDSTDVVGIRFPVPGDNPNTVVIQEGRPHILTNAPEEYPSFREEPHCHIKSWLGVPLKVNGKVIGMVAIDSEKPNYFSKDHIRIVSTFADHVAIAIENAQLFNLATQAVNKRAVLHDVSQEIISIKTERDQIYNSIHSAVTRLMPCDAFVVTTKDEEQQDFVGEFLINRSERSAPYRVPLDSGLSQKVLSIGESQLINDLKDIDTFPGCHFGLKGKTRAIISVPMKSSGRVMGIISAQSYTPGVYTQDDVEILELLAAYAGIAIDNAQLLSEVGKLALTDSLTGLTNRRAFDFELKKEVARASRYQHRLVLLMMDIDDFKQFNDKYGHVAGDEHLIKISNIVCDCLREPDMVFRYGGEEIAVILPFTDLKGGNKLAERIRATIEKHAPHKIKEPGFTVSIGIAEMPSNSETALGLLQAADEALFVAKHMGKNKVYSAKGKISNKV